MASWRASPRFLGSFLIAMSSSALDIPGATTVGSELASDLPLEWGWAFSHRSYTLGHGQEIRFPPRAPGARYCVAGAPKPEPRTWQEPTDLSSGAALSPDCSVMLDSSPPESQPQFLYLSSEDKTHSVGLLRESASMSIKCAPQRKHCITDGY